MQKRFLLQWLVLICIFIVALVLEIAPWPGHFQAFKPAWLVLVLLYWLLAIPNKISIGWAFILGIIWDLVLGSTLGEHALVLSLFAYLISSNCQLLRNLSLWQQSLLVIIFVYALRLSVFLIELFLHSASFNADEIYGALISGLLWPWIFLLLRTVRQRLFL